MDLQAYTNIERLEHLAKKNYIDIPRTRGYRLMSEEEPISREKFFVDVEVEECKEQISKFYREESLYKMTKRYIKNNKVLWDKIHGKFRNKLKLAIKQKKKAIEKQYETFNKYVGRKDVLLIHARVGSNNWEYFDCDKKVATKSWFIEKVDDSYDSTYCDIYVIIKI